MLWELVARTCDHDPKRVFMDSGSDQVTYGEFLTRSESLTRFLSAQVERRIALIQTDLLTTVSFLAASSITRTEVCIYPESDDSSEWISLANQLSHALAVSNDESLTLPGVRVVPSSSVGSATEKVHLRRGPGSLLILTSGTTGKRKAVSYEWRNLLRGTRPSPTEGLPERWLMTYNLHQFAGIQMLLHVLASGATLVIPASRRPLDAVRAIRDRQVTHVSATPTFWRLLLTGLPASELNGLPLRQITLGGEAAGQPLLDRLSAVFPNARLSHVYAASEFGSAVSVNDRKSGLPLSVLDRPEGAGVHFAIRDGELYVKSKVGMRSYFGGESYTDEWFPTGDLVEVRGDRICFVGRSTERINVGGSKVSPLTVEEAISDVPGVMLARVYGRPNPVTGQIVAADVVAQPGFDQSTVRQAILEACRSLPNVARPRRIRFVTQLSDASGKIARQQPLT